MQNVLLRVENLLVSRDDGFRLEVPHLGLHAGKIYGLVGPNGAGKSTLLQVLSLLELPTRGRFWFEGRPVPNDHTERLAIRRQMALVMENPLLFRTSVYRNLTSGLRFRGVSRRTWAARVTEALTKVGLAGAEERHARELSRGQTQRVAIAQALILEPEVLFLDEPFSHVDKAHVRTIERLILDLNAQKGTTVVFTTHDLLQAYRLAHEVISLVDGRLVNGSLENLLTGQIVREEEQTWVEVTPSLRIAVVTDLRGPVHVAIPPQDIILSLQPFESSARNRFQGRVQRIQLEDSTVRVGVDVGGIELTALITQTSLERMELSVGVPLFLTFKTTAVTVF